MIRLVPQLKILLAYEPVDFRNGIDGLTAICRQRLQQDPFSGYVFLFRNRAGTALKLLMYDETGFWLCLKRFSQGRLGWWPQSTGEPLTTIAAQQLFILLYNGNPDRAQLAEPWRRLSL
jgi:transposase